MNEWKVWKCPECGGRDYEEVTLNKRKCRYCGAIAERETPTVGQSPLDGPRWQYYPTRTDGSGVCPMTISDNTSVMYTEAPPPLEPLPTGSMARSSK